MDFDEYRVVCDKESKRLAARRRIRISIAILFVYIICHDILQYFGYKAAILTHIGAILFFVWLYQILFYLHNFGCDIV